MINIILKRKIYVERCKAMIKNSHLQEDSTGLIFKSIFKMSFHDD